jgi:hypothetical protein
LFGLPHRDLKCHLRVKVTDFRCSGGFGCSVGSRCRDGFWKQVSLAITSVE